MTGRRWLGLLAAVICAACTPAGLFIVNTLASFEDYDLRHDISFGDLDSQRLDIYLPDRSAESPAERRRRLPTVVFFYGGCWGTCSDLQKGEYGFVGQAMSEQGFIAVIADYRTYPQVLFKEIIGDASRAVEWVAENIEFYGGDRRSIYLMGHSAGAHLASLLLFDKSQLTPSTHAALAGFIGLAGPYDFLPFTEWYQPALFAGYEQESQPVHYVEGNEAPALLLTGDEDTRVKPRNIISLTKVIEERGGQVASCVYPGIDHAGILAAMTIPLRSSSAVLGDIAEFVASGTTPSCTRPE